MAPPCWDFYNLIQGKRLTPLVPSYLLFQYIQNFKFVNTWFSSSALEDPLTSRGN